ncbi:MAG: hypothetical protein HYV53_04520 [Parcubacteria group bacterium]|nr:hypothetical protein [Parcubacteria group bacterium]
MKLELRSIITPVRAIDSDLIPEGWEVESDDPEGEISFFNLDFSFCPIQSDEYIDGDFMLRRAGACKAYGSLGLAAALLKLKEKREEEWKKIFPVDSRDNYYIMPRTILITGSHSRVVACLIWRGGEWTIRFCWLDYAFSNGARFIRPRDSLELRIAALRHEKRNW